MTSGGQFERLIREGQVLALEPDLFALTELGFWCLSGLLVECRFRLLPSLRRQFHAFLHSGDRGLLTPAIVQSWEVPQ